jgi:uncharacterized protein with PIN domain
MKGLPSSPNSRFANAAEFRFYEELNDFLRPEQRKQTLIYRFNGHPAIKDPIEVLGVPHAEVDLIVVNGASVGFDYRLKNADRVAVYPVFESFDISPCVRLRAAPLRTTAFIVDVNLGKLARLLRLFGFDVLFADTLDDKEIVAVSVAQGRIILTRDRRLLYAKAVTHGYWVRVVKPLEQLAEVVKRFDLADQLRPFSRCTACNGLIEPVEKQAVLDLLEPKTRLYYERFYRCPACGKVYWEGSHIDHIRQRFAEYLR